MSQAQPDVDHIHRQYLEKGRKLEAEIEKLNNMCTVRCRIYMQIMDGFNYVLTITFRMMHIHMLLFAKIINKLCYQL